jgi:hypothetical protein
MEELINQLNVWAILVASITYFVIGFIWYAFLFAKPWMELSGIQPDDGAPASTYALSFLLQLIGVCSLALVLVGMEIETALHGMMVGGGIGLGIIFSITGTTGLYEETPLGLHAINNGYHVVGFLVAGAILGGW